MFGSTRWTPLGLALLLCACGSPAPPPMQPAPPDLSGLDAAALQARMTSGELSARRVAEWYLDRIAKLDRAGPTLRSVIELNPDVIAEADRLDLERKAGKLRGPLHGIPLLIKDNIDTADRMHTSAGSLALATHVARQDAAVVARLRDHGVVLLGKTNLSEWANFRSTHSSSGWSARGGQTRNPYVLDRNPCGSSAGTGAAIAAELASIGVGTETDGSIVCPASANGLVGIKPTLGLVSRAGIVPIAHSQDTAGPMARSVADAALLLNAMVGSDARDPSTADADAKRAPDYTAFLAGGDLKGLRIGVARKYFGFNREVDALMAAALDELKRLGAELVDPADIPTKGKFDQDEETVLLFEFKAELDAYLSGVEPTLPRSLAELIAFNREHASEELPWFGQELFEQAQAKPGLDDPAYREALANARRLAGAEGIDAVMDRLQLDALVAPTGGPAWLTDLVNGDHFSGGMSSPPAVAGYPHVTVPAGLVHELPVGVSFFGRAFSEPVLLRMAYAYEQRSRARKPPRFLPTVPGT